jgi:c-di-GMP-binding flagellar brake protein YcgR
LDQKRKYPRIKRPLQIFLIKERQTAIKGNIVDISEGGALIQLETWADFKKDEKVLLEIYPSRRTSDKSSHELTKVFGLIKRIEVERQQLAIVFLSKAE